MSRLCLQHGNIQSRCKQTSRPLKQSSSCCPIRSVECLLFFFLFHSHAICSENSLCTHAYTHLPSCSASLLGSATWRMLIVLLPLHYFFFQCLCLWPLENTMFATFWVYLSKPTYSFFRNYSSVWGISMRCPYSIVKSFWGRTKTSRKRALIWGGALGKTVTPQASHLSKTRTTTRSLMYAVCWSYCIPSVLCGPFQCRNSSALRRPKETDKNRGLW